DTPDRRAFIKRRTGLDLDATFTAAKLAWVCSNHPKIAEGLRNGSMLFGTIDTWLTWSFTGGNVYATEAGNASRTMLFDISSLQFDPELLALFGLEISSVPEIRKTNACFGSTHASQFGTEFPIHALAGDQQASLFGHGCLNAGQTKITFGTGAFIWSNAGTGARPEAPQHGIVETIAWDFSEPTYAYEGFVTNAGRALAWLSDHLAVEGGVEGLADAAMNVGTSNGVQIAPAFQGLSAPWWQSDVQAAILGITSATEVGHIAYAGFEAVAHQVRTLLELLPGSPGAQAAAIRVDGGLRHFAFFVQLQADILQASLYTSEASFLSAKGAALMAGLGASVWTDTDEIRGLRKAHAAVEFRSDLASWAEDSHARWLSAVEIVINFSKQRQAFS
ncbi:MAG: FGGY-family carbohydrate kinase, partial [Loktanella sp.]|nr:FGGY-family carbohydrate kinase [Loktanella sp.]